jgi:GntR family transcriptional regulator, transcriptional repressor for pyruvate dehydrogenase complex
MPLAPIGPRESSVDACEAALRRAILSGELSPGDRLPPERTLAVTFGASRVTVRSALGRLSAARLVTARQGSGYVVRDFQREGGPELLAGLIELPSSSRDLRALVADLLLVRRKIAEALLERLVDKAGPRARARIAHAVDAFAAIATHGAPVDTVAEADLEVAAALLAEAGSPVLALCLNPVSSVVRGLPELRAAMYADPPSNVAGYRLLLAFLDSPDAEAVPLVVAELRRRDEATLQRLRLTGRGEKRE